MNVSNGTLANWIPAAQFQVSDNATPYVGTELNLTESAQDYNKVGGISIGSYWQLWYQVDIPSEQAIDVYNTGYWTWSPSPA
jgi:hypothetical protein